MSESLQSCLNFDEAYDIIAHSAQQLFAAVSGGLFLLDPAGNFLEMVTSWGETLDGEPIFAPNNCMAVRRGRIHLSGGPAEKEYCRHFPDKSGGCYFCLPLMAQKGAFGLLHLQAPGERDSSVIDQIKDLAITVTDNISLALANIKLRETLRQQLIHDSLTGLFNRRYLDETLEREIHRVRRKGAALGVIMMDIDHFKRFNDTHGHEAGDSLLEALGNFLKTQVRVEDIACRYGGEEFVLIMPEASLDIAQQRAEEIRREVPHLQVADRGRSLESTTVSLGVAIFPDHGATGQDVLRAADDAMYQAKKEGRNRVVVAEGGV